MKKKIVFLIPLLAMYLGTTYAQLTQNETTVSSGAVSGSSGKGNSLSSIYTPDLYTGTVNVSIPFYNYSIDGLDFGVSLSYNTGGIKVDDVASDAGLGWVLNTGAMITREVKGIEDEITFKELDTTNGPSGPNLAIKETRGHWVTKENSVGATYYPDLPDNQSDEEPDIFNVSLGKQNFNFSLKWVTPPITNSTFITYKDTKNDVLIDVYLSDSNAYSKPVSFPTSFNRFPIDIGNVTVGDYYILRFKITDKHGNQFFFDRGDCELRDYALSSPYFSNPTVTNPELYTIPNSWVISKIITYTGAVIKYTYSPKSYDYPGRRDQRVEETKDFDGGCGPINHGIKIINNEIANHIVRQQIQKIEFPNGDVVDFKYDNHARLDVSIFSVYGGALDKIEISKGYDATVHNKFSYKFNYSYINSESASAYPSIVPYPTNSVSNPLYNLRLQLNNIYKIGTDNTTSELYYKFGYIDGVSLPPRLSGLSDCYGYYNGNAGGVSTLSGFSQLADLNITEHYSSFDDGSSPYLYGRNKAPNWTVAKYDLLNEISNGLNGKLTFEYQDHNLSNPPDFGSGHPNSGYYEPYSVYFFHGWANYQTPTDLEYPTCNDGICIKSISMFDGYNTDNNITTTFDFEDGMRFVVGGYSWYPTAISHEYDEHTDAAIVAGNASIGSLKRVYFNSFVGPRAEVHGFNHGYSVVREKTFGYNNALISHKLYQFTNLIAGSDEKVDGAAASGSRIQLKYGIVSHTLPFNYFRKNYMGLLKSLTEYVPTSSGAKLSETVNSYDEHRYPASVPNNILYGKVYFGVSLFCAGHGPIHNSFSYFESAGPFLISQVSRNYSGGTNYTEVSKYFTYDNDLDLYETKWDDSKGNQIIERNYYNTSLHYKEYWLGAWSIYLSAPVWAIDETFNVEKALKFLAAKRTFFNSKISGYTELGINYVGWSSHYYNSSGNHISDPNYHHGIKVSGAIGGFRFDKVMAYKSNDVTPVAYGYTMDNTPLNTVLAKHFTKYNDHNNVLETGYNDDQSFSSAIWDTRIGQKIAEVSNAHYDEIAYTSFEGKFNPFGTADYNKGNWDFNPAAPNIVIATGTDQAMTGRYYYNLTSGGTVNSINPPLSGKKYFVSVWYKGTRPSISSVFGVSFHDQLTVGDWTLATCYLIGNGSSQIGLYSTSYTFIDELRLIPADAAMQTYTYEPLVGKSSQCDERNKITYFEYDAMGRPTVTRDIKRNIISLQKHVIQGNDN